MKYLFVVLMAALLLLPTSLVRAQETTTDTVPDAMADDSSTDTVPEELLNDTTTDTVPDGIADDTTTDTVPDNVANDDDLPTIDSVEAVIRVIDNITNWMFTIFLASAVIMVLFAAFKYLTSGGGEETAKAHKILLYAAIAIAVALFARGIIPVVKSIIK